MFFYHLLDWFFTIFHSTLMIFNLIGWCFAKLRKLNLITLLLTASMWTIAGIWYGLGYCPLTDWHYDVLRILGYHNLPNSYLQFIVHRLTGLNLSTPIADIITVGGLILSLVISIILNYHDYQNKRKNRQEAPKILEDEDVK